MGCYITIDTSLIETDFLDVSFNLEMDNCSPYRKPNNNPPYIHSESNHPPFITTQLPSITIRHISNLSCYENEFNNAKHLYESALKNRGFNYGMKFGVLVENSRRNTNRKVLWSNLAYSLNVKTNIGKVFIKLVGKHFLRSHKFNYIFNLNTIEINYNSVLNVKNSKILNKR